MSQLRGFIAKGLLYSLSLRWKKMIQYLLGIGWDCYFWEVTLGNATESRSYKIDFTLVWMLNDHTSHMFIH